MQVATCDHTLREGNNKTKTNSSLHGTGTGPRLIGNIFNYEGIDEEVTSPSANQSQPASYAGHYFMAACFS